MTITVASTETMKVIETTKHCYLAAGVDEDETTTTLRKAVVIDPEASYEDQARDYVRGTITGKAKTIKVKNASMESIEDADDAGPLVELMQKYVPLAEKNARANAILVEVDKLLSRDKDD